MKRTLKPSSGSENHTVVRRLWTGEDEARDLLTKDEPDLNGVLLQHARVADSVTKQGKDDSRVRRFRISTETQDRHGDIIRSKGIVLKHFRKNPVVLFAHDSRMPPIGKSPKITTGDGFVEADVDFFDFETFAFADTIFRIVDVGGLKATSIGFMPLKFERMEVDDDDNVSGTDFGIDFKKIDLLEFSIVPVPANPEAIRQVAKSGAFMSPYKDWLDDMQDNWQHVEPLLLDLGIVEADVTAVRKAVDGDAVSVRMPDDWGEDAEDTLKELDILDVDDDDSNNEFNPLPLMVHEDTYKTGEKIVELEGEFPKHTSITVELIERADLKYVSREDGSITISLDNATAKYEIVGEDEDQGIVRCALTECDYKTPITWAQAHPSGTPAQPRDAPWNAGREVREATVESLGVISAWREKKPKDELVKGDFKFPHHRATGQHPVNFRAIAAGVAVLNGARGGTNIPASDKRGVWNHLARHFRDDFDADPPALKWAELEPLKECPDLFYFDYASAKLLVLRQENEEDAPTFVDAREVAVEDTVSGDIALQFPDSPEHEWHVHTLSSRRRKWTSLEEFMAWAKDEGFNTESLSETRHFWRLAQSGETVSDSMVISLYPNDVEPGSADCVVQATLILKPTEVLSDDAIKIRSQSVVPSTFALAADGSVDIGVPLDDLDQTDDEDKQGWALLIAGLDMAPQVLVLEADSPQVAHETVYGMAKAFGSKLLYLGRLVGTKDGASVYTDYALYRFKNGTVLKTALDAEAIDELQDFLDGLERLKMIVQDLSDDERQQLMAAKEWLDEVLVEEGDDHDSEEDDDLETLLVQSLSEDDGGLPEEIRDAVKDVVLDLTENTVKEIAQAATRKEVGVVD